MKMFRKILSLLMTTAVIANLAIASFCHAHCESTETSFRPHIHFGNPGHTHDHGHGHSHLHGGDDHQHGEDQGDGPEKRDSICAPMSHDSDAIFFSCGEIFHSQTCERAVELNSSLELPAEFWLSHRRSETHTTSNRNSRRVAAHALILKKIRLLL